LNHTLLTLESIRARGLNCPGIILNHITAPSDAATCATREILEQSTPILLEIHPAQGSIFHTDLAGFLDKDWR